MRYFVISDIHGFYDVMVESLTKSGYDSTNENHHLLILGDMFDRGHQSKEVLHYIYDLYQSNKATVLLGNHDTFLIELLQGDHGKAYFNMLYNGFGLTLESLSGIEPDLDNLPTIQERILQEYPYLLEWLKSLPYFIEIGDYIFVHGGIDGGKLDWRSMSSPHDFIWSREHLLPAIEGKTVVAGHTRVPTIRRQTNNYHLLHLHHPEDFDILYMDGKILIDRYVEVSQELNVLILDL